MQTEESSMRLPRLSLVLPVTRSDNCILGGFGGVVSVSEVVFLHFELVNSSRRPAHESSGPSKEADLHG